MKISCNREKLQSAFQTAASVAPSRSPKPILQNVKLEIRDGKATLLATDLELGIRISVPDVEIHSPGDAILPVQRFGQIVRVSSDETLRLESDGQRTIVRGERSEFSLQSPNPAEFPMVAQFEGGPHHELSARALRETIRRTAFATDNESSRYALGGVLLEFSPDKITAVGTDGRRLAKMEAPATSVDGHGSGDGATIVPTKAMNLIERALTDGDEIVKIAARASEILIVTERMTIYSRLLEGRFPKWRDVFPKRDGVKVIDLPVGPFHSAVKQAAIVTSDESRGVDFTFDAGAAILQGKAAELGQARVELPISYDGPSVSITLDPKFLGEYLHVLNPETTFQFALRDEESAGVCTTDDAYGYVIMPLARDR